MSSMPWAQTSERGILLCLLFLVYRLRDGRLFLSHWCVEYTSPKADSVWRAHTRFVPCLLVTEFARIICLAW